MSAAPTLTWEQYQKLPPAKRSRPLTAAEYGALTQSQREQAGLEEPTEGAPADFAGPVFPNPDHVQPQLDTDAGGPVTRFPQGVTFQRGNWQGKAPADISNPAPSEVIAPAGQLVGAKMSTQPLTLPAGATLESGSGVMRLPAGATLEGGSSGATKEQPSILDREIPLDSYTHATESGVQSIGRGLRDAVKGIWQTVEPPKDNTEKAITVLGPAALPLYRTLRGLGHTAEEATQVVGAVHDINQSPDPTSVYGKVAQETAGQGAGQALLALGTEGAARAAPAVAEAAAPAIRATARGVNKALAKAPATVGTAVGAGIGAATKIPYGTEVGAGLGSIVGKELLPKLRIPGEGFGLPGRVEGGPAAAPAFEEAAAETKAPVAETKTASSETPVKPADVERALNESLGGRPLQPGVSLRNQPAAQAAAAGKLPEGFTPVQSSVLRGYKYDPAAQEFESITNSGQHYIHGDVSPEQAQTFAAAESKGKAWNDLRQSSPLVGKVVNGQRVAAKPPVGMRSVVLDPETGQPEFSDVLAAKQKAPQNAVSASKQAATAPPNPDLTDLLQKSLEQARTAKNAPRFVYRARDVGEEGVPLSNEHAQATSDVNQALKYAEPGQRGGDWGQVVRIDLSQLKPSDYVVHTHPDGMKWVQFTRPLSEDEVTAFAGKGAGAKQNVNLQKVKQ